MATRIFLMGAIILFFGAQLRAVDTFVLNEKVSKIINRRMKQQSTPEVDIYQAGLNDPYRDFGQTVAANPLPVMHRVTPPRWLGWSFLSIGAILVLTCPLFRT